MADTKITALTALTAADPSTDVLPIVDTSDTTMAASGTTKKISINNILGASGTATLASATISGDLTVDTSTLKVDSANNRVGIGTATPARPLDIVGSFQSSLGWVLTGTPAGLGAATRYIGGASTTDSWYFNALTGGNHLWAFGESLAMTLNSTGLGLGRSPISKLTVDKASQTPGGATPNGAFVITDTAGGNLALELGVNSAGSPYIQSRNSTTAAYYDLVLQPTSGNVGIGVTPSAWVAGAKALQFGAYGALAQSSSGNIELSFNSYNSGAGAYKYLQTDTASLYRASSVHSWFVAPSGTAGNAITFTQAMTLESTGSLVLGAAAVATTATDGFLYIPGCAGTPTGTPTAKTGRVPLVVDTTNNKLYFYSGGAWVAAN